jgi:hypothetical protein
MLGEMRVAGRFLFVALCMMLIVGVIGAFSGNRADVLERGAALQNPQHAPPTIEPPPVSAATSSGDEWAAAPVVGFVLHVDLTVRAAAQRTSRAIALTPETALSQRPPPHTLFA